MEAVCCGGGGTVGFLAGGGAADSAFAGTFLSVIVGGDLKRGYDPAGRETDVFALGGAGEAEGGGDGGETCHSGGI
jgi:hypothetical protein